MKWWWNRTNKPTSETQTQQTAPAPPQSDAEREFNYNITFLFILLDRDNTKKGYNDAKINPDSSNMTNNLVLLLDELKRSIDKVTTFYEDFKSEIASLTSVEARKDLKDQNAALQAKNEIAVRHMQKIQEIKNGLNINNVDNIGFLLSYKIGFQNGISDNGLDDFLNKKF